MIQFDNRGYITPYNVVETDLIEFEQTFNFNEHRINLFKEYQLFLESIQKFIPITGHQLLALQQCF